MWPVLHRGGGGETGNAHEIDGAPPIGTLPPEGGRGGERAGGARPAQPRPARAQRARAQIGRERVWGPTRSQLLTPLALRIPLEASDVPFTPSTL